MPISRGQEPRQLYQGGGIMNLEPRQEYGLGSIVKSVKKAVSGAAKGIKSLAKSDVGKMALLLGGGYLAGGGTFFGKGLPFLKTGAGGFSMSNLGTNLGLNNILSKGTGMSGIGKTILGGSALASIFASQGISDEQAEEIKQNPVALRGYLTQYYKNLNQDAGPGEVNQFVEANMAEYKSNGGRIGAMYGGRMKYADGSEDMVLPMRKPEIEEMISSNPGAAESGNPISTDNPIANLIDKYNTYKKAMPGVADETRTYLIEDFKKSLEDSGVSTEEFMMRLQEQDEMDEPMEMAKGGRIGYALGSDEIVDQASGIMGLPKRTNKAGVKELDLRDSGGFIPPVGVKEKADDVPAMLSNNEFVFTADAVRGMGDGNVNKGAQRMYDMMKKLEKGGRV
jgi:hypothetical protein